MAHNMKMAPEHFEALKVDMEAAWKAAAGPERNAQRKWAPEARMAWDTFWAIPNGYDRHLQPLYAYLSDKHIETALVRIYRTFS